MTWISVKERVPDNSECVLITDGKNIGGAHYFAKLFNPRTKEESGPTWGNQHYRLTGGYIIEPTHWMPLESLFRGLDNSIYFFDDEYTGSRFTYGLKYPLERCNVPPGWIVGSNCPHPSFRFGTVDYPFEIDDNVVLEFSMERVNEHTGQ